MGKKRSQKEKEPSIIRGERARHQQQQRIKEIWLTREKRRLLATLGEKNNQCCKKKSMAISNLKEKEKGGLPEGSIQRREEGNSLALPPSIHRIKELGPIFGRRGGGGPTVREGGETFSFSRP